MTKLRHWAPRAALIAVILTIPLVLGYWGAVHPALDSLAHFRLHLAVLIALLAIPTSFERTLRSIALALAILSVAAIASTLANPSGISVANAAATAMDAGPARYRLLQLNLRYDNRTPKQVLSLIGRVQPDVITLDEVSDAWREELKLIEHAYPYRVICEGSSHVGGVAILSRRPFLHPSRAECYSRGSLAIATVNFGGAAVDIGAIHLGWPWPHAQHWHVRKILAPIIQEKLPSSAILAGDLNAVWWSHTVRMLAAAGDLKPLGNIGPTWFIRSAPDVVRRYAGLPIDNIFVKGRVVPVSVTRLESVGSDHLPLLFEFDILPTEPQPAVHVRRNNWNWTIRRTGPVGTASRSDWKTT